MITLENLRYFLDDLKDLCDQYKIYIGENSCEGICLYDHEGRCLGENLEYKDNTYNLFITMLRPEDLIKTELGNARILDVSKSQDIVYYHIKMEEDGFEYTISIDNIEEKL